MSNELRASFQTQIRLTDFLEEMIIYSSIFAKQQNATLCILFEEQNFLKIITLQRKKNLW